MKQVGTILSVLALLGACDHDLGPPPTGQSITGTLTYAGTRGMDFAEPAFLVIATTSADPDAIPHALKVVEIDDPSEPLDYELFFLPNGRFFLIGQLVDLADFDPVTAPVGAYPNNCVLTDMPMGRSLTVEDMPATDIDITIRDNVFEDECFASGPDLTPDECPAPNRMAVVLSIESATPAPTEGPDRLVLGLFDEYPPTDGAERIVARPGEFELPMDAGINEQEPGAYYVYACYDVDGDDVDGVCGDEDRFAVSDAPIDLSADMIHRLTVDLDAGTITLDGSAMPDVVACTPTSTLRVDVTAPGLVPDPGDTLNVTVFRDFPGLRDPDYLGQSMPASFPTTIDVPVDPDDYFVIVCFQTEDSTSENCAGPEDRLALYMNLTEEVIVGEDETVTIDVELPE